MDDCKRPAHGVTTQTTLVSLARFLPSPPRQLPLHLLFEWLTLFSERRRLGGSIALWQRSRGAMGFVNPVYSREGGANDLGVGGLLFRSRVIWAGYIKFC